MLTKQLSCRHCASAHMTRHGLTNNGKQRYFCHDCGRDSRDNPHPNGYPPSERDTFLRADDERSSLRADDERSSLRGLSRTFGLSRNTLSIWLNQRDDAAATTVTNSGRARRRRAASDHA